VVALFFGWAVIEALKDEGFSKFSPAPVLLGFIVVIGGFAAVIAAIRPARRAAKLDILEAISHE
jgi:putative ABC transport system permease protein